MDEVSLGSPEARGSQQEERITLSDVIAAIETELETPQSPPELPASNRAVPMNTQEMKPEVVIVEQPASKALRFRYQCEGRSAGSIPGATSTTERKTFPTIRVKNYRGPAVVLVSCVTKEDPPRPHPHNLVGREGCKKGVCTMEIPQDTMEISFPNLGIQCVKKRDIAESLDERKAYKVDPYHTGFGHKNQPTSIDLNVVRLCFQVYITNAAKGDNKYSVPLPPIVSDPIYDKKAMCDLTIVKLSDCNSTVDGGRKDIILLCEKVTKEDIEVRFFETDESGRLTWEAKGDFQPSQVHKQTAIWFRAPRYKTLDITESVMVNIQLRRPSDGAASEPLPFEMLPMGSDLKRKRPRDRLEPESNICKIRPILDQVSNRPYNTINPRPLDIKEEPIEAQAPYVSPVYFGHSPTYPPSISPNHYPPSISPNHYPPGPVAGANIPTPCYPLHNELLPPQENHWQMAMAGGSVMGPPTMLPQQVQNLNTSPGNLDPPMNIEMNDLPLLNSSDLEQIDTNALSDNLSNNLNISENIPMSSGSLSRLAESEYMAVFKQGQQ